MVLAAASQQRFLWMQVLAWTLIGCGDSFSTMCKEELTEMERGGVAAPDWEPAETATQGDETLRLMFAVKHQHVAQLEQILWDVSEPTSPSYGHFWSLEQINSLVGKKERSTYNT